MEASYRPSDHRPSEEYRQAARVSESASHAEGSCSKKPKQMRANTQGTYAGFSASPVLVYGGGMRRPAV
jgi:hypothetical protein